MVSHQQHFLLLLCSCNYQTLEQLPVIFWVFYFSEVLWMLPTQLREKITLKKIDTFSQVLISRFLCSKQRCTRVWQRQRKRKQTNTIILFLLPLIRFNLSLTCLLSELCKGNLINEQRLSSSIVLGEFVRYFERTLVIFVLIAYNFWQYFFSTDSFQRKNFFPL